MFSHITKTSAMTEGTARIAESVPAQSRPASVSETAVEKRESAAAGDPSTTGSIAAAANAINPPLAVIALPVLAPSPVAAPADAKTLRERGIYAYRAGDLSGALAHFNRAIAQDPTFAAAYIDRGIVFYRMRDFDRAFADMAQAKRLAKTGKPKSVAQVQDKPPAPVVAVRAPVPRWHVTSAITP